MPLISLKIKTFKEQNLLSLGTELLFLPRSTEIFTLFFALLFLLRSPVIISSICKEYFIFFFSLWFFQHVLFPFIFHVFTWHHFYPILPLYFSIIIPSLCSYCSLSSAYPINISVTQDFILGQFLILPTTQVVSSVFTKVSGLHNFTSDSDLFSELQTETSKCFHLSLSVCIHRKLCSSLCLLYSSLRLVNSYLLTSAILIPQ